MEYVKADEVRIVSNSSVCKVLEYELNDKDLNGAVVEISGRYPDTGWALNQKCKMLGFVLKGTGRLTTQSKTITLSKNDMVLILPGEKYYWDGHITLLLPATPAWYPEQYVNCP